MKKHAGYLLLTCLLLMVGFAEAEEMKKASDEMMKAEGWILADAGLLTPESVLYDSKTDMYYVSNIGGPQPLEKDNNGFISKLNNDGTVTELKWIEGGKNGVELNAPKGSARCGDMFLVCDIDVLRLFDFDSGEHKMDIALPGATFANDVYATKGKAYVTDTGAAGPGAIYVIQMHGEGDPEAVTLVRDEALHGPNGILRANDMLIMVPYGGKEVFQVKDDGSFEVLAEAPTGALDGLVLLNDGRFAFTSWEGQTVYVMNGDHSIEPLFTDMESPADIGYDSKRNLMLVPIFMKDKVVAKPVK